MLPHLLPKIKEKLSDHEGKLQEAQDLLYSAQGKTRQAGSLADQNRANLTALEVCIDAHTHGYSHMHTQFYIHAHTHTVRKQCA